MFKIFKVMLRIVDVSQTAAVTSTLKRFVRGGIFHRYFTGNTDEPKLTKSDEVKYHSVNHYSVEKTPITAQLWMQRTKGRESLVASTSSIQPANSYISREPTVSHDVIPTFLLDKTANESRLTIRYKFSEDGMLLNFG